MPKPLVRPLAAGALLTLGCAGRPAPSEVRPTDPAPAPIEAPPPPPAPEPLPTWEGTDPMRFDADGRPHATPPPPRTNPPTPALLIGPDGACYRASYDARRGPDPAWRAVGGPARPTYRVDDPEAVYGRPIQCPDDVAALLDADREP